MAVWSELRNRTYIAGADLTEKQFHFVKRSGANVVAGTAGDAAVGVLWNDPDNTQAASVVYFGSPTVKAGGDITAGAAVAVGTGGVAVAAAEGNVIVGYAREAAVNNQFIRIDLDLGGNEQPA
jgi:hypothetical protein